MKILCLIFLPFFCIIILLCFLAYFYRSSYKLITVIGKKGSGKTTLITKLSFKYQKRGWKVYSNVEVPGAWIFDPKEIGLLQFDSNSVIFIDEVSSVFNNRDFKNFDRQKAEWFRLQRHYRCVVYIFGQAHDSDAVLRRLTDDIYLVTNFFNVISVARKVKRTLTIVHPSGDSESRIADDLQFVPLWLAPFGGLIVTWLPAWQIYFDSFDAPELPLRNFRYYPMPEGIEQRKFLARLHAAFLRKLDCAELVIRAKLFSAGITGYALSARKLQVPLCSDPDQIDPDSGADDDIFYIDLL